MPWSKPGRWKVKVTKMTKSWEKPKAYKQRYIKKRQKSCDALYKKGFKRYLVLMQTTPISADVLYCSASTEPEHIRIKLKMLEAGGSSYPCPCCWKGQCSAGVRPCLHPSFPTWSPSFSRLQPLGLGLAAAGLWWCPQVPVRARTATGARPGSWEAKGKSTWKQCEWSKTLPFSESLFQSKLAK